MMRALILMLLIALVLVLAACGGGGDAGVPIGPQVTTLSPAMRRAVAPVAPEIPPQAPEVAP